MKEVLLAAHELGMVNGRYAFLATLLEPKAYFGKTWNWNFLDYGKFVDQNYYTHV